MTGFNRHEHLGVPVPEVLAGLERDGFVVEAARLRSSAAAGLSTTLGSGPATGRTTLLRRLLDAEGETL